MLIFQNIGKIIKNLSFLFLLVVFLILVDFKDLSFKTVVPQPEIKIDKKMGSGIVKNIQKEKPEKIDENFQGNEQDILKLVNQAREESGAEPLAYNEKLALSALDKAQHMKENEYFDHVSPQGLQPWYFAQKRNYEYKNFGENLAEGFFFAESVHEGWMNSDGHRENILSRKFQEIGVGILDFTENGQKSYLIVQHFGSQLTPEDLVVKTVCDKQSKENCEEAEEEEEKMDDLIEEQEDIIKEAKERGVNKKEIDRLEENLEDLEEADDELEDYLDECEKFIEKCDVFE
jgi:uncharacterized protein YkwD